MDSILTPEIMALIVPSVIAGIGFLVKYILNKRDEAQKKVFEERDKDKAEMKEDITNLKKDVKELKRHNHNITAMVLKCKHPDCETKEMLAQYWEKEEGI